MEVDSIGRIVFWETETNQKYPRCGKCEINYADWQTKDGIFCDQCVN